MFSKMDKAWAAGLVTFVCQQVQIFAGIEISAQMQAVAVTLIVGLIVWLTPNKEAA